MDKMVLALLLLVSSTFLLDGCVVAPDPYYDNPYYPQHDVVVVPALPEVVVLHDRPYYSHQGYHYFYDDGRWFYTRNQRDRWRVLPHSHWPRDTRYRDHHPPPDHHGGHDRYRRY